MTKVILIAAEKVLTVFQKFQEASKLSRICRIEFCVELERSNRSSLLFSGTLNIEVIPNTPAI